MHPIEAGVRFILAFMGMDPERWSHFAQAGHGALTAVAATLPDPLRAEFTALLDDPVREHLSEKL